MLLNNDTNRGSVRVAMVFLLKLNLKCSLTSIFRVKFRSPYQLCMYGRFYICCQCHLNLQIPTRWDKWNQIIMITMLVNPEVETNQNQSIHSTRLIQFCFEKPPSANCQGK